MGLNRWENFDDFSKRMALEIAQSVSATVQRVRTMQAQHPVNECIRLDLQESFGPAGVIDLVAGQNRSEREMFAEDFLARLGRKVSEINLDRAKFDYFFGIISQEKNFPKIKVIALLAAEHIEMNG